MLDFLHFVVTRFNVDCSERELEAGPSPHAAMRDPGLRLGLDWCRKRLDLLEEITFPSVVGQTCRAFKWVVLADASSPPEVFTRLTDLGRRADPLMIVQAHSGPWRESLYAGLGRRARRAGATHLVTTRLDCDDGLGREYIGRVRKASFCAAWELLVLDQPAGHLVREGVLRARLKSRNQFITLVEYLRDDRDPIGICCPSHGRINEILPDAGYLRLDGDASWLLVDHDLCARGGHPRETSDMPDLLLSPVEACLVLAREYGLGAAAISRLLRP